MVNLYPAAFKTITSSVVFSAKSASSQQQQQQGRAPVALYALSARVLGLLQLAVSPRVSEGGKE
jgi:hypothetical protein